MASKNNSDNNLKTKFSLNFWLCKLSLGPLGGFYKLESKPVSLEKIFLPPWGVYDSGDWKQDMEIFHMLPLSPKQTLVWNLEKHFVNPVLEACACGWSCDT